MNRRILIALLKLCFGVAMLVFALRHVNLDHLRASLPALRWGFIAPLCVVALVRMLLSSVRWQLFITTPVPLWTLLRLYFVGVFFNTFLPSNVGGDVYKGVLLVRYGIASRVQGLTSSLLDRLSGIVGLLMVGLVACMLAPAIARQTGALVVIVMVTGAVCGFTALVVSPAADVCLRLCRAHRLTQRCGVWLHDAATVMRTAVKRPRLMLQSAGLSLLTQICDNTLFFLMTLIAGAAINWHTSFVIFPLIVLSGLLPVSLNGIGVVELSTVELLKLTGTPENPAVLVALLLRAYLLAIAVIGFVCYLFEEALHTLQPTPVRHAGC
ncbi:MAG: lysylphosphatidylglycerol synthase transmembrane domain-containing protein [bacterium]|nr:lysylphosphatidylglycerol synthase transmembrane domain-containing protein [bacterium]